MEQPTPTLYLPDVMLDLETLGIGRDAAIISIGALKFDRAHADLSQHLKFYRVIRLREGEPIGNIEPQTVLWWTQQDQKARDAIFGKEAQEAAVEFYQALAQLQIFMIQDTPEVRGPDRLWSNGPLFDERLIREAGGRHKLALGSHYRASRSCRNVYDDADLFFGKEAKRTLKVAETIRIPHAFHELPKHHALGDCFRQAAHVQLLHETKTSVDHQVTP